jgi:hypothetical protein
MSSDRAKKQAFPRAVVTHLEGIYHGILGRLARQILKRRAWPSGLGGKPSSTRLDKPCRLAPIEILDRLEGLQARNNRQCVAVLRDYHHFTTLAQRLMDFVGVQMTGHPPVRLNLA